MNGESQGRAGPSVAARAGMRIWRLFTSVNFAVVQIVGVAVLAVFGMTIRQLPWFAFRSAGDYATEMGRLRSIYEPALGVGLVDLMERLQLFRIFTSTPFARTVPGPARRFSAPDGARSGPQARRGAATNAATPSGIRREFEETAP